jgi:hypothetical protein
MFELKLTPMSLRWDDEKVAGMTIPPSFQT